MNAIIEYASLAAILSPVFVLVGLNVWLALAGEKGTLLLPSGGDYPAVELPEVANPTPAEVPSLEDQVAIDEPAFRKAA